MLGLSACQEVAMTVSWENPPPHNDIIRVSEDSTRAELEKAIAALRAKQDRMPQAWVERREQVSEDIDRLVEWWLAAKA